MPTNKNLTALLAGLLFLTGCGGGSIGTNNLDPVNQTEPQATVSTTGKHHKGIGPDARKDYRRAMYDDCAKEIGYTDCSISGNGWFYPWNELPKVHISSSNTQQEVWAIRRAIGILNRSLPVEYRHNYQITRRTFSGIDRDDQVERSKSLVPEGVIHVEIYPYDDPESGGVAWTNGKRGYALGDRVNYDLATPHGMRALIDTMVHEFLHAFGLSGHPHAVHTSIMSYRHYREGELDSVPLIDAAILYDLYEWGSWDTEIKLVSDYAGGVHFGVDSLHQGTAIIPWVDAGHIAAPRLDELSGRASYSGTLVGYADDEPVHGDADLSINFNRGTGVARFHRIADWNGNSWNRSGYRYDLDLYGHYFDSTIDSQDRDGIPDVVGAFYGFEAETVAGTLQRPEITAAFGAVK